MRVILADDSMLLREGLARLLGEAGFDVVGRAGDADELHADYIIPSVFDRRVAKAVAEAVAEAAIASGVARRRAGAQAEAITPLDTPAGP